MDCYIQDSTLGLLKYTHDDDLDMYKCWKNKETQRGFNYIFNETYEQFIQTDLSAYRFFAVIYDKKRKKKVGCIRLCKFYSNPDLSIWIYKKHRNKGYAKHAYYLGMKYCFETLHLSEVVAGCYETNLISQKLLKSLGMLRDEKNDIFERNIFTGSRMKQLAYRITPTDFAKNPPFLEVEFSKPELT